MTTIQIELPDATAHAARDAGLRQLAEVIVPPPLPPTCE
jgi:hypothetical protein